MAEHNWPCRPVRRHQPKPATSLQPAAHVTLYYPNHPQFSPGNQIEYHQYGREGLLAVPEIVLEVVTAGLEIPRLCENSEKSLANRR